MESHNQVLMSSQAQEVNSLSLRQAFLGHEGYVDKNNIGLNFPIGIPDCVDVGSLLDLLINQTPLYQELKRKNKRSNKNRRHSAAMGAEDFDRIKSVVPEDQKSKLNRKHLTVLPGICDHQQRMAIFTAFLDSGIVNLAPEVSLINEYHRDLYGEDLIDSYGGVITKDNSLGG